MTLLKRNKLATSAAMVAAFAVLVSPVIASAATDSDSTTVNATVGSTISLTTNATVNIGLTPTSGAVVSSASDTVTVNTNNSGGYSLSLADSDATTDLVSGGDTIAAHAGSYAAPSALADNTWGYRIVNQGGFGATAYSAENNNDTSTSTWAGVPASGSAQTVKTTGTTATNDVTTVWYGARVNTSTPTGTYSDTVTYTAVTN